MRVLVSTSDINNLKFLIPHALKPDNFWEEVNGRLRRQASRLTVASPFECILLWAVLPTDRTHRIDEGAPIALSTNSKRKELWVDFNVDLSPWMFDKRRAAEERAQLVEKLSSRAWACLLQALQLKGIEIVELPAEVDIEIDLPLHALNDINQVRRNISELIERHSEILGSSIGPTVIQYTIGASALQSIKEPIESWLAANVEGKCHVRYEGA